MKRSRLFLGLTTGALAIAGVVAAKVSFRNHAIPVYYFTSQGSCQFCATANYTATVNGSQATCAVTGNGELLYTNATVGQTQGCTKKAYKRIVE